MSDDSSAIEEWEFLFSRYIAGLSTAMSAHGCHVVEKLRLHLNSEEEEEEKIRILDLASGNGDPALQIAREIGNCWVLGTDLLQKFADSANARAMSSKLQDRIEFRQASCTDIEQLKQAIGEEDVQFDAINCSFCFMYLPSPLNCLKMWQQLLKPRRGFVVITTWGRSVPFLTVGKSVFMEMRGFLAEGLKIGEEYGEERLWDKELQAKEWTFNGKEDDPSFAFSVTETFKKVFVAAEMDNICIETVVVNMEFTLDNLFTFFSLQDIIPETIDKKHHDRYILRSKKLIWHRLREFVEDVSLKSSEQLPELAPTLIALRIPCECNIATATRAK